MNPSVTRIGVLDMQVCVPSFWEDSQIVAFANERNPCGTELGWTIRRDPEFLAGCPVRNPCDDIDDFVHVTLDA